MKHIGKGYMFTNSLQRFIRAGGSQEFYRIDGSVQFVVNIFVEHFQHFLDDDKDPNAEFILNKDHNRCLYLLYNVALYLFETPAVQDLFWNANITTMMFQLSKLRFKNANDDLHYDIYWILSNTLLIILRASVRERTKFRELGGVKWITKLSFEMFLSHKRGSRKTFDKMKKKFLDVQQIIIGEEED